MAQNGDTWFATARGLSRLSRGDWTTYTWEDGLPGNEVWAAGVDSMGHLWLSGVYWDSIVEFYGSTWIYHPPPSESLYAATDIEQHPSGVMWFVLYSEGVASFDGTSWTTYTADDGLGGNEVNAIAIDRSGHIWAATAAWGASEFDGTVWTTYREEDGLVDNHVQAVTVDLQGSLWFGTADGVSEFDGVSWTSYTEADGLASNNVRDSAVDRDGHMWFATDGGVSEFDGTTWTTYTQTDGLTADVVSRIAVGSPGHWWFGTWGSGVTQLRRGVYLNYLPFVVDKN